MRSVLVAALATVLLPAAFAATARAEGRDLTGQPAPEIYIQQGLFGAPSGGTLQTFRGRPLVLKFFFTDCPVCRETLPEFERQFRRFGPRGVQFLAVAYDSRWAVEAYWRRAGFTAPVAIDENGIVSSRYGIRTYPTAYLIGADGVVRSYDAVTDGLLERELSRARVVVGAPVAGAAAAAPAAPAPAVVAERNVRELGDLPAALAAARDAARENDYGAVLRLVEPHLDPTRDSADVVAAARRLEGIAKERFRRREARIEERWTLGDRLGAYEALALMADDFKGTQLETAVRGRVEKVRASLVGQGLLASR